VLRVFEPHGRRQCLYCVTEYIEGWTLRQWMTDNPRPALEDVRAIVTQIAAGLRAFHRLEMVHPDLKPENIVPDRYGTVKIIDCGSTRIAGIEEISTPLAHDTVQGTRNSTAPEYLLGLQGNRVSDIHVLGVIAYEPLTGQLPYGLQRYLAVGARRLDDWLRAIAAAPVAIPELHGEIANINEPADLNALAVQGLTRSDAAAADPQLPPRDAAVCRLG